jgi:hypothetical protein
MAYFNYQRYDIEERCSSIGWGSGPETLGVDFFGDPPPRVEVP